MSTVAEASADASTDAQDALRAAARQQFGYLVGLAGRDRLPHLEILLPEGCLGGHKFPAWRDLNVAVRGASTVIRCESDQVPETLRLAAFRTLAEIAAVIARVGDSD